MFQPRSTICRAILMTPELQRALKRHMQWFGSYKKSGGLKKIQVWLTVNEGRIEFLTPGNSYKVKRVRRNPRVVCSVGSKEGPAIVGTAEIVSDRSEVSRVYRRYWKIHPVMMALGVGLRVWIEMLLGMRVVVRVRPDEQNPLAGVNDPA
jgi:Pyridoxamine 5'-phosphate oxidase